MILTRVAERKLNASPTSLHLAEDKIYIGLKKRYIIETEYNALKLRRIPVKENIRTMVGCENSVFLFSEQGNLFVFPCDDGNARNNAVISKKIVNTGLYDQPSRRIIIGTSRGKALVLSQALEIHKTFYESPSGIIGLSISDLGKLACVYEIDSSVRVFDLKSSDVKEIKIPNGFPQAAAFISSTHLVIGSSIGEIYLVDTATMSILFSSAVPQPVSTLLWKNGLMLIGGEDMLCLSSVTEDGINIIESCKFNGFVNAVCFNDSHIVVGIGKEPRLGRWKVRKDGEHKLVVLKTE
ncbi:hypothetical protein J0A71_05g10270 [Encephalitozoon cuniculi]|nr:hypothetical protein J0A71_05g10270 [Encephalitozoon cuniculi]